MASAPPRITASSFVLDLLSTLRRGAMPVRALVEAAALFEIAEGSVRVALTRLLGEGLVERDERGLYRLGAAAEPVRSRVATWRDLGSQLREWSGAWIGVFDARAPTRLEQRRSRRALDLLGFRALARGLEVRPDNLAGGIDRVRDELAALGLAPGAVVCELRGLDAVTDARARSLWEADALVARYRKHCREIAASTRRLGTAAGERAMVESFRVGGAALRTLAKDPLLPEPIVPAAERDALVAAMREYDALGRASWTAFLARHGVAHRGAPIDTRALVPRALVRGGLA
jgi:phenylacetic acid degradation operon negative regulatory protein